MQHSPGESHAEISGPAAPPFDPMPARPSLTPMKPARGFTLIELMTTLAVAVVILTVGVPSFQELIKANTLNSQVNSFVAGINLTRSEAIKRSGRVSICKSSTLTTCTTSGGWEQGWIVFFDLMGSAGVIDSGDTIIRTNGPAPGSVTIRGNFFLKDRITFLGSGIVEPNNGTIIFCDNRVQAFTADKAKARAVVISKIGRVKTIKGNDSSLSSTITSCTPS